VVSFAPTSSSSHCSMPTVQELSKLARNRLEFPIHAYDINNFSRQRQSSVIAKMVSDDGSDELLETASRLRKEAETMEESIRGKKAASTQAQNKSAKPETPNVYNSLNDSTWRITYRFASDAVSKEKETDDEVNVTYYSGKVDIKLTDDGYTNLLDSSSTASNIKFEKFWGWDEENSKEDDLDYVLFSADVRLPEKEKPIRYYFQSQINTNSRTGEITLVDGTVTLKKDVEPPGGFWGVFNAGGILAQFRYCGEFIMKPI
jgi:hypothetical protein